MYEAVSTTANPPESDPNEFGPQEFGWWNEQIENREAELVRLEGLVRRIRARQVAILTQLDTLQVDLADGDRGMEDWTSAHLDVTPQTATRLITLARESDPRFREKMSQGIWGLDRAALLAKLARTGAPQDLVDQAADQYSLGRLWGLIQQHRQISHLDEQLRFEDRYLVIQPSLDQQMYKLWGQLYGTDGETVQKALDQRADGFPTLTDQPTQRGQLLADALTSICTDSLTTGSEDTPPGRAVTVAEVFIDASMASPTRGETGATLPSGLRVGPATLEEILCDSKIRAVWTDSTQGPMAVSHLTDSIPPAIRAYIWQRDQGTCSIEGCRSRNRLQIHHIKHQSQGGSHHPDNLILLCWYHHHIAIHMCGFTIDPDTPIHRRRLQAPRWQPATGPPW